MATEHEEHFVIERIYKVWTGLPDNKAARKIKEYCGSESILGIDKEDGYIVKSTQSNMMKLKLEMKEMFLAVESKEEDEE